MPTIDELRTLAATDPAHALDQLIELFVAEEYDVARPAKAALVEWQDPATSARLAAAVDGWMTNHTIAAAHALEVLGRRRDAAGLAAILSAVTTQHPSRKGNPVTFREALFALAAFATDDALAALRDGLRLPLLLLDDQNRLDKVTAGIAELAEPSTAYELLSECLTKGGDDKLTTAAICVIREALEKKRAVDPRWSGVGFDFVRSSNASIKAAAIALLAGVEHPEKADRLLALASEGPLPQPLLSALGRTKDPRAIPVLLRAMEPAEPIARSLAESTLGITGAAGLRHFGDAAQTARGARFIVEQLRVNAATWDGTTWNVGFACSALGAIGDRSVVGDVKTILAAVEKRGAKKKDEKVAKERMKEHLATLLKQLDS